MKCPYCLVSIKLDIKSEASYITTSMETSSQGYCVTHGYCPNCGKFIILLKKGNFRWVDTSGELTSVELEEVIFPKYICRITDPEVPERYRNAVNEASAVLTVSPKASAALSRRLLQEILREEFKLGPKDLSKEIEAFILLPDIPTELTQVVDAIRNVGNFATHPIKSQCTGEIVDVEMGEAEWLLQIFEILFEHTYIRPKRDRAQKDELNKKLAELGKPPMK